MKLAYFTRQPVNGRKKPGKNACFPGLSSFFHQRRRPDSNRDITDLQSAALAVWLRRLNTQ